MHRHPFCLSNEVFPHAGRGSITIYELFPSSESYYDVFCFSPLLPASFQQYLWHVEALMRGHTLQNRPLTLLSGWVAWFWQSLESCLFKYCLEIVQKAHLIFLTPLSGVVSPFLGKRSSIVDRMVKPLFFASHKEICSEAFSTDSLITWKPTLLVSRPLRWENS